MGRGSPLEFFFPGSGGIGFFPSITMPTDGKDFFRIFVDVSFFHTGINCDTGLTIDVSGDAYGSISFYRGADGYYYPDQFVQAPQPATLGLIGTGLVTISAALKKCGLYPRRSMKAGDPILEYMRAI